MFERVKALWGKQQAPNIDYEDIRIEEIKQGDDSKKEIIFALRSQCRTLHKRKDC